MVSTFANYHFVVGDARVRRRMIPRGTPCREIEAGRDQLLDWTVAAWCVMCENFRNFRIDRILEMSPSDVFEHEPEIALDYSGK